MLHNILISSGVMRSDSNMSQIAVEMENTTNSTQTVILRVLDWTFNTPADLLAPTTITIPAGQIRVQFVTVFCKRNFLTFAKIFPQAPVGKFYVNPSNFSSKISYV